MFEADGSSSRTRGDFPSTAEATVSCLIPAQPSSEDIYVIKKDLRACMQRLQLSNHQQDFYIGVLKTWYSTMVISVNITPSLQTLWSTSVSLAELLGPARNRQDPTCQSFPVPYYKRLMLAKQLSRAGTPKYVRNSLRRPHPERQ